MGNGPRSWGASMCGTPVPWRRSVANWLRSLVTSGTDEARASAEARYRSDLEGLLDRRTTLGALDALIDALRPNPVAVPLERTAIGLDANVFLRLSNHPRG